MTVPPPLRVDSQATHDKQKTKKVKPKTGGWRGARRGESKKIKMDWGRAEGRQAGGQKTAPGHGREPQADGLGGKQRQSEGGTLQEACSKDD